MPLNLRLSILIIALILAAVILRVLHKDMILLNILYYGELVLFY